jgi:tetratricopeptide (TPR) repeat protein
MPAIGYYHPIVVHFAIALCAVGVLFRWLSLALRRRAAWLDPAALALLILGAGSAAVAAKSGHDAHGPVEHMPGGGEPLGRHQQWGLWARNVFFAVVAAELAALVLARRQKARPALVAAAVSGVIGAGGLYCVMQAGKSGGRIVYAYAGGVGTRGGDPKDVGRLLLAGLHFEAQEDRSAGRHDEAAELYALAGRRFPDDPEVQLAAAEALLVDRKDPAAALEALRKIDEPEGARGVRFRKRLLIADALAQGGKPDEAIAALERLAVDFPASPPVERRLDALRKGSASPK